MEFYSLFLQCSQYPQFSLSYRIFRQLRCRHLLQLGRGQEQGATCEEVDFMIALLLRETKGAADSCAYVVLLFIHMTDFCGSNLNKYCWAETTSW
jgi:hypothetical protein